MFGKSVAGYKKFRMSIINELSGVSESVMDEIAFYDVGYMQSQINRIQKEIKRITKEIEVSLEVNESLEYEKERRNKLMEERELLLFHMIFLASNSFNNLDDCIRMADGHNFVFMKCIKALMLYQSGEKREAFSLLEEYYSTYGCVEEHFLVNKVFGLLLVEKNEHQKAIPFLAYALQFVPDDMEVLEKLSICYKAVKDNTKEMIIKEILSVLC